jgi:hypothetical protein
VASWMWLLLAALEVIVIVAEWRLLLWTVERETVTSHRQTSGGLTSDALTARRLTSRRLLLVSLVMNGVSATLGTFLLSRFS